MKNSLQNIISSLSAAEKRQFKKHFNKTKSEKQYVKLFDFICATKNYSDEKASKKLGNKHIRVLKFRLQENLLMSLSRNFTANEEYKRPDINQIKVLQSKRLFEDAAYLLEKQLKVAKEIEDFHLVLKLLDIKKSLFRIIHGQKYNTTLLLDVYREKEKYLGLLNHIQKLEKLIDLLLLTRVEFTPDRTGKIPRLYAKYLKEHRPYLNGKTLETTTQKYLYYDVIFLKSDYEQNPKKSIEYSLKKIELHRSDLKSIILTQAGYASSLNNHLTLLFKNNLLEETPPFIKLFRELESPDLNLQTHIFYASNVAYTNYLIEKAEIMYNEKDLAEIENQFDKIYERQLEKEMTLKFNIGVLYFRLRNYKKARRVFYKLLTDSALQIHIQFYAHVLFLITLFEMKEMDVFEKEAASFIHLQKKKGSQYIFEITLFEFLKQMISKTNSEKEIKQEFRRFFDSTASRLLKGNSRQALDYFYFQRYLQRQF
jgi:hypothetical protein